MSHPKIKRKGAVVVVQPSPAGGSIIRPVAEQHDHNYLVKLRRLAEEGTLPRGEFHLASIAHDDWCGIYRGDLCDCEPDIYIERDGEPRRRVA
jgi:hypothetical protein